MPDSAKILAVIENYPSQSSNEGETIYIFDVNSPTARSYLAHHPWGDARWERGPVPDKIINAGWDAAEKYGVNLNSSQILYLAQDLEPMAPFYDGKLMVIDTRKNRVFFCEWNH